MMNQCDRLYIDFLTEEEEEMFEELERKALTPPECRYYEYEDYYIQRDFEYWQFHQEQE